MCATDADTLHRRVDYLQIQGPVLEQFFHHASEQAQSRVKHFDPTDGSWQSLLSLLTEVSALPVVFDPMLTYCNEIAKYSSQLIDYYWPLDGVGPSIDSSACVRLCAQVIVCETAHHNSGLTASLTKVLAAASVLGQLARSRKAHGKLLVTERLLEQLIRCADELCDASLDCGIMVMYHAMSGVFMKQRSEGSSLYYLDDAKGSVAQECGLTNPAVPRCIAVVGSMLRLCARCWSKVTSALGAAAVALEETSRFYLVQVLSSLGGDLRAMAIPAVLPVMLSSLADVVDQPEDVVASVITCMQTSLSKLITGSYSVMSYLPLDVSAPSGLALEPLEALFRRAELSVSTVGQLVSLLRRLNQLQGFSAQLLASRLLDAMCHAAVARAVTIPQHLELFNDLLCDAASVPVFVAREGVAVLNRMMAAHVEFAGRSTMQVVAFRPVLELLLSDPAGRFAVSQYPALLDGMRQIVGVSRCMCAIAAADTLCAKCQFQTFLASAAGAK